MGTILCTDMHCAKIDQTHIVKHRITLTGLCTKEALQEYIDSLGVRDNKVTLSQFQALFTKLLSVVEGDRGEVEHMVEKHHKHTGTHKRERERGAER